MKNNIELMKAIDSEYRSLTGLTERRFYSIFFSMVKASKVMIIGYNPGGDPDTWDESALASTGFYENGEHEYVDTNFPTSLGMRAYLLGAGVVSEIKEIRDIPKTNLIFRRSRSMSDLPVPPSTALQESKEFIERIIKIVQPEVIVCEGKSTLEKFESMYCKDVDSEVDGKTVFTPNGRHKALIYRADKGLVDCLGRHCTLVGIGHPSKYRSRQEWSQVMVNSRKLLSSAGLQESGVMPN